MSPRSRAGETVARVHFCCKTLQIQHTLSLSPGSAPDESRMVQRCQTECFRWCKWLPKGCPQDYSYKIPPPGLLLQDSSFGISSSRVCFQASSCRIPPLRFLLDDSSSGIPLAVFLFQDSSSRIPLCQDSSSRILLLGFFLLDFSSRIPSQGCLSLGFLFRISFP